MSSGLASRLKHPKKHELVKSHSQAQILANKLRQDGVMEAGISFFNIKNLKYIRDNSTKINVRFRVFYDKL